MTTLEVLSGGRLPATETLVVGQRTRRVFDLAVGVPLCVVAVPLILVLALVLAGQHRATPLFVHKRLGRGGRLISIPKLRTLACTTHPYADKTVTVLEPVSRLAVFLRRTHLDELPQLFLVPFGTLSLVGPRPRMEAEALECPHGAYGALRTSIAQGCTGLWQISDKDGRVSDHPEYDLFYLEQRRALLDAWILWRTAVQILGVAPVRLEDIPRWVLREPLAELPEAA